MKDDNHNKEQSEEEGNDPDGHSKDKPEHKFNKCETLDEGTVALCIGSTQRIRNHCLRPILL